MNTQEICSRKIEGIRNLKNEDDIKNEDDNVLSKDKQLLEKRGKIRIPH